MPRRDRIALTFLYFALALIGCREQQEKLLDKVEFSGCREVLVGPICELEEDAKLVFWVKAPPDAELRIRTDDQDREVVWSRIDGGRRAELTVSTATKAIELVAKRKGVDRWRLPVTVWKRPAELREAERLFRAGKIDEAEQALKKVSAGDDLRIAGEIGTRRASLASARGDEPRAIEELQHAAGLADRSGVISKGVNDRLRLVHSAIFSWKNSTLGRTTLETLGTRSMDDYAPGALNLAYYRGILAKQTGDYRTALRSLELAEGSARRLGVISTWWFAVQARAFALAALGMNEEALKVLEELDEGSAPDHCARGYLFTNRLWLAVMARESGGKSQPYAAAAGEKAFEIFSTTCPRPTEIANALSNLALDAIQRRALGPARTYLARARAATPTMTPFVMLWLWDVEGRIELADGNSRAALAAFERLRTLSEDSASPDAAWRAAVGRAAAFVAEGRKSDALTAFAQAEAKLDDQSLRVSVGDARNSFVAARAHASDAHADLLLDEHRAAEAVAVIRRARVRALRGLQVEARISSLVGEKRARWDDAIADYSRMREQLDESLSREWALATDREAESAQARRALAAPLADALDRALAVLDSSGPVELTDQGPKKDEVVIGFHRTGRGWIGFAISPDGVVAERVVLEAPSLLDDFDAQLERSQRVRVLVDGPVARMDLHALAWRGQPLVVNRVVTYAMDVQRVVRPTNGALRASIIADPLGDLPAARDEGDVVAGLLEARGADVLRLSGGQATRAAVIDALRGRSLVHYAGHGRYDGASGWGSVLPLAGSAALTVGDILALTQVPAAVVLSGCETAETSETTGQQIGLAQAFVLAGAETVIAASRPVSDALAKSMAEHLYAADEPLPEALRAAQKAILAENPSADWAAFRAISP